MAFPPDRGDAAPHADPLILRHEPNDGIDVFIVPRRLFDGKAPLLLTPMVAMEHHVAERGGPVRAVGAAEV